MADRTVETFLREVLPDASAAVRAMTGELVMKTLSAVGADFSEKERTASEIEATPTRSPICSAPISVASDTEAEVDHSAAGASGLTRAIIERSTAGFSGLLITGMSSRPAAARTSLERSAVTSTQGRSWP